MGIPLQDIPDMPLPHTRYYILITHLGKPSEIREFRIPETFPGGVGFKEQDGHVISWRPDMQECYSIERFGGLDQMRTQWEFIIRNYTVAGQDAALPGFPWIWQARLLAPHELLEIQSNV